MKSSPKFDPWSVMQKAEGGPANLANRTNPAPKTAEISSISNISRGIAPHLSPNGAEIIDLAGEFEERAAIREYDGGLPRTEAERLALEDVAPDSDARTRLTKALRAGGTQANDETL